MESRMLQLYKFPFMSDYSSHLYLSPPPLALEHEGVPRLCPPTFQAVLFTSALLQPLGGGGVTIPLLILILLPSVAKRSLPRRFFPHMHLARST